MNNQKDLFITPIKLQTLKREFELKLKRKKMVEELDVIPKKGGFLTKLKQVFRL
jgi:hypothetical protein